MRASSPRLPLIDDVFTAPLHGFRNTDDYWARGSSKPHLSAIRVPTLVVNALNDPFIPARSLPGPGEVGRHVTLWQPAHGVCPAERTGRLANRGRADHRPHPRDQGLHPHTEAVGGRADLRLDRSLPGP